MPTTPKDIEQIYNTVRLRLNLSGSPSSTTGQGKTGPQGPPGPPGPKGITWRGLWIAEEDYEVGDLVYLDTAGGGTEEKLTYLCLAAHHSTAGNPPAPGGTTEWWEIGLGYLIVDGSRPMTGDLNMADHEVDAIRNANFQSDVTEAVVNQPSRVDWNKSVTPGTDYTEAEGTMSWSDLEDTVVVVVASGAS